jgi:AAA domain
MGLDQLVPRAVSWLWPGRLALGKLSILEGDPQRGKSLLALELCARLSTGRAWPDDSPSPGPAAALIVNGEDGDADTTVPRLRALGADLGRCFVLERGDEDAGRPLLLPTRTERLAAALAQTSARLLVIDPVMAFMDPQINTASDPAVRRALAPLAHLAQRHDCAVVLILHLNKAAHRQALYRGLGSIALVAACRSAWLVAPDPLAPSRSVLAQVKNNLAPTRTSLAFEIGATGPGGPTIDWLGATDWSADKLLVAMRRRGRLPVARERAREFICTALRNGPRTARSLWDEASALGLAQRTLLRAARKHLGVKIAKRWEDGRTIVYWLLNGQKLPPLVPPDKDDELDRYLRRMHECFPEPSPLDES